MDEKSFFSPENVRKRWKEELSERDIIMIESFFSDLMKIFNYSREYSNTLKHSLFAFLFYLWPHRSSERYIFMSPTKLEIKDKADFLKSERRYIAYMAWRFLPLPARCFWIYSASFFSRAKMLLPIHKRGRLNISSF